MSRVFSRGINFMGQLGIKNGKTNLKDFQEIPSLHGQPTIQVEAHMTQSACLLADGQILNWGWVLDSLTTARTLNYYKRWPNFVKKWQKYSPFGPTLGMRIGFDEPNLLNKSLLSKHKPTKISLGGSFIICLSSSGDAFGSGENYKGQLGTGDIKFKHDFAIIDKPTTEKILDVVAGFQHSLYLADEGSCFATGRCNWRQYLPFSTKLEDKEKYIDFNRDPQKIILPGEKITKLGAGFAHSLFLTSKNKLYAIGLNNYGQCGHSSLNKTSLSDYSEVFVNLEPNDEILDIKCGKAHNLLLTKQGYVYGFGASTHNQLNWKNEFGLEVCGPRKIDLPLKDEKVIKIKSTIDRNAVITDKGNCYVWGGENLEKLGGEAGNIMQNIREQIPGNPRVRDVGLGYMHTLALTE